MRYLPLHFDMHNRRALVLGGGEVAERKIDLLLAAGAAITCAAPSISAAIAAKLADSEHKLVEAEYTHALLEGVTLVVAATDSPQVNAQVSKDAQALGKPVNVVDAPSLCTVTFPAIIDRSPLLVSLGTGGASPTLGRRLRERLEALFPQGYARLTEYLGSRRPALKDTFADTALRRRATEAFLDSPGATLAMSGKAAEADKYLFKGPEQLLGEVYLVGAGPGDPDLLTLKALHLMQQADTVLYDNLVSPQVLERTRRDARKEFVGKRSGYKSSSQEDINALLVRLARQGQRVLRLKGGDPFIFGRGGEEIEPLLQAGIPFQVVPGITAANGCAAYAGIPLTHRELARSVKFVTGHPKDGEVHLPWQDYTREDETLVFYMGLGGLASISRQLIGHGRSAETPVAVISKGTTPEQQILTGTLETIPGLAARTQIQSPTLIIVGQVVGFAANQAT